MGWWSLEEQTEQWFQVEPRGQGARAEPTGWRGSRWNWEHIGRSRAWDSSSQDRAGGLKGTSGVRAEGMAGFSGACRRGRLGEEAESVIDRTGGDEEHFVLHGTGDIKDSKLSGISDNENAQEEDAWVGRLGSTTSIFQSISQFCSSSSTEISTSMDYLAHSHTWSARTLGSSSRTDVVC